MVDSCGGTDALENLQNHDNEEVYEKALKILKDYFQPEEDAPGTNQGPEFTFGSGNSGSGGAPFNFS